MGEWSRESILEWVGDDLVLCMDASTERLPVPDWLLAGRHEVRQTSIGQRLAATRADERQRLIDLWWDIMAHPGETRELEVTVEGQDGWSRERLRYVNLLDHPDVSAVVTTVAFLGASEGIDLPESMQAGEYEAVNLLIHELDGTGVILRTEGQVQEISGRSPEEVIGQSVLEHLHPDGFDDAIKMWLEVMSGPAGTCRTCRQRVQRPDGTTIWVENTLIKREADDGTVTVTAFCHDLTERRRQEAALRTSQLEFRLLADQVPAAVFRADEDQRVTFGNERWTRLVGEDASIRQLGDIVHRADRDRFDIEIEALLDATGAASATVEVRSRDRQRVYLVTCQAVTDLVNERRSLVGSVTDITDTVELRERAEHDPLTGLHNRAAIEERLAQAIAEGAGGTAVVFVDLDGFKQVNDTYGHQAGDLVLTEVAARLGSHIRSGDTVGRYGGDEFVMILRDAACDDATIVARVEDALREPVSWEGGAWSPAVSIGLARPSPTDDPTVVLQEADRHMFATKRLHKLRVVPPTTGPADRQHAG